MERKAAISFLVKTPYKFGHMLGFSKLTELHNDWIRQMILNNGDATLLAHRGSYKTTCVTIAIAIMLVLFPDKKMLFMRKTDEDIKEVIYQVKKILQSPHMRYFVQQIYGVDLTLKTATSAAIDTSLSQSVKGTVQLLGIGTSGSLTGKHYDIIFTDDIVNVKDRVSKAERDRTKLVYQELQNIKNRGGRIYNTGTLWHKDDAFSLMPPAQAFDCYSTGLMTEQEIADTRSKMTASLFACNYELRIIASEDVIFESPQTGADPCNVEQGVTHIDAAYGGEDWTAMTICRKIEGKYYILGKCWRKHVDDVIDKILDIHRQYNCGKIFCEDNGDKGYLAKALRAKGERVLAYHESQNKFLKITSYLKAEWKNVIFVVGTDTEYINQICDYNENVEHDDCPDSLASIVRRLWGKENSYEERQPYKPVFM